MDTCIGGRFYDLRAVCKITVDIVHMLVDIVSKNGNLLLNIPLRSDRSFDDLVLVLYQVFDFIQVVLLELNRLIRI